MLSIGEGCHGFTYDSLVGEFILTHPDVKVSLPCVASIPFTLIALARQGTSMFLHNPCMLLHMSVCEALYPGN